jgi:TorA maturation chaperone TorD
MGALASLQGSAASLALARARAYALFAELLDRSVDERCLELASLHPELAAIVAKSSVEAIAADHCFVFDLTVPPFEGLVRDPEARVGNEVASRVQQTLSELGIELAGDAESEHLAVQLEVMARLCTREAEATSEEERSLARAGCATMLDRHLLGWLLVYESAVARCGREFPTALIAQIVDLVLDHRGALGAAVAASYLVGEGDLDLDLDDEKTDLRAIAGYLSTPEACGVLFTRDDITRVGRQVRVPRGFGGRRLLLLNLVRSAAQLGELENVLAGLRSIVVEQRDSLSARAAAAEGLVEAQIEPWSEKVTRCLQVLDRLAEASVAGDSFAEDGLAE